MFFPDEALEHLQTLEQLLVLSSSLLSHFPCYSLRSDITKMKKSGYYLYYLIVTDTVVEHLWIDSIFAISKFLNLLKHKFCKIFSRMGERRGSLHFWFIIIVLSQDRLDSVEREYIFWSIEILWSIWWIRNQFRCLINFISMFMLELLFAF